MIKSRQFNKNEPTWLSTELVVDELSDETNLVNMGFDTSSSYFSLELGNFEHSIMN